MKTHKQRYIIGAFIFLLGCQSGPQKTTVIKTNEERTDFSSAIAEGSQFVVSTQGRYASLAAQKIFRSGGNIIDAMVAASFVISVERPQSTGIGGGGFLVFHYASTQKTYAIDFRERAPINSTKNMFVRNGKADADLSQNGFLAVAVPGLVAGLFEIHERFGKLPMPQLIAPAIELAEQGFELYPELHRALSFRKPQLQKDPESRRIFLDKKGEVPPIGSLVIQKDLAQTLRQIANQGKNGFYKGSVAKSLITSSQKNGGVLSQKDLDTYSVKWRNPIQGSFKNYSVLSMPPPSSGGVHVIQFLNFLEQDQLKKKGHLSTEAIHLAASALQSAFADRAEYLGDPDFVQVPTQQLIDPKYVQKRRQEVSILRARKADEVKAGKPSAEESTETTHLSIIDAEGNAVSTTQTINGWMGAAVVAPGTGIVLNNEMDDFAAQVGASNLFGAIGGAPNAIAPKKTPLSSMSPTILLKDGKAMMAVGAPGGTRIISCVAQTILNYIEFETSLYDAVASVRYHHQWKPDILFIDPPGPTPETLQKLKAMNYDVQLENVPCNVMAVSKEGRILRGVADPRDIGTSLAD